MYSDIPVCSFGRADEDEQVGKEHAMKDVYFTITGMNHYFGSDYLKKGMKVKLVKEPDKATSERQG